jgi:serine/threonine protein kinase
MLGVPETPREARVWDATYQAILERGYEFDRHTNLKSGASAVVMKAREKGLKRDVALKVIVDPTSERSRKLFERESKMLTAAGLPEVVVRYHTKIEPKGKEHQPVLVLEWIDGQSLGEFLKRQPPRLERRLELTRELFERLAELHESGWFWRDLSPNNILIDRKTGHLRFIDFGLAKLQADRQASIHTLGPGGTPYFTKDAILAGEIQATVQDDVRAAAMMALRVLGVENAKTRETSGGERLRERKELIRELRSHLVPAEFGERLVDVLISAEHRPESTPGAREVAERLANWFKERALAPGSCSAWVFSRCCSSWGSCWAGRSIAKRCARVGWLGSRSCRGRSNNVRTWGIPRSSRCRPVWSRPGSAWMRPRTAPWQAILTPSWPSFWACSARPWPPAMS